LEPSANRRRQPLVVSQEFVAQSHSARGSVSRFPARDTPASARQPYRLARTGDRAPPERERSAGCVVCGCTGKAVRDGGADFGRSVGALLGELDLDTAAILMDLDDLCLGRAKHDLEECRQDRRVRALAAREARGLYGDLGALESDARA